MKVSRTEHIEIGQRRKTVTHTVEIDGSDLITIPAILEDLIQAAAGELPRRYPDAASDG